MDLIGTIDYCDEQNIPSLLRSFDYQCVFDSGSHKYFDGVLQFYGFNPIFRQWIKSLYDSVTIAVLNNGHTTDDIKVESSFHQGCVLSPGNFVLSLRPLILQVKQEDKVWGIQLNPGLNKMFGLFSDDIWATTWGTQQNLDNY